MSRYPDEDERIFAGGMVPIRVETVKIIETRQSFDKVFEALFLLDSIVNNGEFNEDMVVNKKSKNLICDLMNVNKLSSFDCYIQSIVKSYKWTKKQIDISIWGLRHIAPKLCGLVFRKVKNNGNIIYQVVILI